MTLPKFSPKSSCGYRSLAGAALFTALSFSSQAHAQILFYVSETAVSNGQASIAEYSYDPTTNTATSVNTTTLTGVFGTTGTGAGSADANYLSLSQDGSQLAYAGLSSTGTSVEALYTPTTGKVDTSTTPGGGVRSAYYGSSTGNFYLGTGSKAVGVEAKGGTVTPTTVVSDTGTTGTSTIGVAYNPGSQNLFLTRNSTSGGVYMATSGSGLSAGTGTSATTANYTLLTGTGWTNTANTYTGLAFLGSNDLFVADTTTNTLEAFINSDSTTPTVWNIASSLNLNLAPFATSAAIEALTVYQTGANSADIFFTTDGNSSLVLTPTGTSTVEEVSWNSTTGFGTPNVVLSSTDGMEFTGLAIPEPSTYAMMALGLGFLGLMMIRKNAGETNS